MKKPANAAEQIRRAELPMQTRTAPVTSVDAEKRTAVLCFTTGADVTRYDWWKGTRYIENLDVSDKACDLSRLNGGAPLLNSHNMYDLSSQIGVVERAWIDKGNGYTEVRFPKAGVDAEADTIFQKVADGIIRNVSVGYMVRKYEITDNQGDGLDVYRAVDWQPMEVSLVTVPADAGAGVRAADQQQKFACEFVQRDAPASTLKENEMDPKKKEGAEHVEETRAAPAQPVAQPDTGKLVNDAIVAERARCADIRKRVALAGFDAADAETIANDLIERGVAAEHAGNHILEEMSKRGSKPALAAHSAARVGTEAHEKSRDAIVEALSARSLRTTPSDAAREFMGMRLLDIAVARLGDRLSRSERDPTMILRAAHTSSDFPYILEAASNKIMLARYAAATPTFRKIARQRDLNDFKATNLLRIGDFPTLLPYGENGEIKSGTINEGKEQVTLGSYGRIVSLSRQAIINDDLGAFDDVFGGIGYTVSAFENALFYSVKNSNSGLGPTLKDTYTVFQAANHKNYTSSGAAISVDSLGVGRAAIRKQTNLDGNPINAAAKTLLVSPDKETIAQQYVATVQPVINSAVNPFSGQLEVVADAALSGNAWELYADPAVLPVWSFGYLASSPGPRLMVQEQFNVDGTSFRLTEDFYAAAIDYRGGYRNAGA